MPGIKIGVVGKGGAGKTTVAAFLVQVYTGRGRSVIAVDTDSNPNLAVSLGMSPEQAHDVPVIPIDTTVGRERRGTRQT